MSTVTNRWGKVIRPGDRVHFHLARGGTASGIVAGFDTTSRFAKTYGVQLKLHGGGSVGADDVLTEPPKEKEGK